MSIRAGLLLLLLLITFACSNAIYARQHGDTAMLCTPSVKLVWKREQKGWSIYRLMVKQLQRWTALPGLSGEYTFLYSAGKPDSTVTLFTTNKGDSFPGAAYKYPNGPWKDATGAVALNTAGSSIHFFPGSMTQLTDNRIVFSQKDKEAMIRAEWSTDAAYTQDIQVKLVLTAVQQGYFSLASPSLLHIPQIDLQWGMIPGVFQGNALEPDFVKAYAYGQGIPDKPVIVRERTTSTLSPLISLHNGITLSVIPASGTGRDPWIYDHSTHKQWQLGLSLMNRRKQLMPTAWHPVLGEKGSFLKAGDSIVFSFRYSMSNGDWYGSFKHAVYDVYKFKQFLTLKQTQESLTERVLAMRRYLINDTTSKWITDEYNGIKLGAQAYLGGVYGSKDDAVKNADYGAMWMLASVMNDPVLRQTRLPFALNFKKVQQQQDTGFFQGAAIGQYYLLQSKRFTEEWGNYVEPVALTYYIMMDLGNILLFNPNQPALKEQLRKGADRLLSWMNNEGEWAVAYNRSDTKRIFTDLKDLRPTFYGLVIAYKLLGDVKYLQAACSGADWFIRNAVNKGHFLGVCGDGRFAPDFATGQSAQALLDLYNITGNNNYREAAVQAARWYTTSVYTHPVASETEKKVKGVVRRDADISQAGLSFEHGGIIGSANGEGPILLASHAGLFVRMFAITGDSTFIDMARAAAWGRDAFVDPATHVASYYWSAMNRGPGSFPHHAWWQVGWIMDYLIAELSLRSNGSISFPAGFVTPKVGPHHPYGFANGKVFDAEAQLILREGLVHSGNAAVDYITAINRNKRILWIALLNNSVEKKQADVRIDMTRLEELQVPEIKQVQLLNAAGNVMPVKFDIFPASIPVEPFGLNILEVHY